MKVVKVNLHDFYKCTACNDLNPDKGVAGREKRERSARVKRERRISLVRRGSQERKSVQTTVKIRTYVCMYIRMYMYISIALSSYRNKY